MAVPSISAVASTARVRWQSSHLAWGQAARPRHCQRVAPHWLRPQRLSTVRGLLRPVHTSIDTPSGAL